jgi:DNA-binding CsgD family transcriptional regulator
MLLDRLQERAALSELLDAARAGRSGVLVMRGEPGIGKTALLDYAVESAAGLRVARVTGVESETELPFAALHQLCAPMLDQLDALPDPQREALGVAFGRKAGAAPNRFLVGLATLSLLSEVAERQPLLCVIDDVQWLDRASAQALAFVARRLLGEPVALLFATRDTGKEYRGLPELMVGGLRDGDARELLSSVIGAPLDGRVRDRIVAETHGNPLALLELPRGIAPAELAGGFGLPNVPGLPGLLGRIEDNFRRRLEGLPAATQRLMLVAAAEPVGDPLLVWRAAQRLGIGTEAVAPAADDGLLAIGERVTFRHPLVRSAAYHAASPRERRAAHQALAEVTDPRADLDRRAWHRAHATLGPDEDVASELERSAGRAQARGGLAAAAAFLERCAALTLDPVRRAERALAAAQAKYQAGAFDATLGLLATAEAGPADQVRRARADLMRGQIALASSRGSDAPALLLRAARQFEPLDPRLARETYLEALTSSLFGGRRLSSGRNALEVAQAARAAPPPPPPPCPPDLLLDGLALLVTEGYSAAVPVIKRAMSAFRGADPRTEDLHWLWPACHTAVLIWDYESWDLLSARLVKVAREAGALAVLPIAFSTRAGVHLFAGEMDEVASLVDQGASVSEAIGSSFAPNGALTIAAFRGRGADTDAVTEAAAADAQRGQKADGLSYVQWVTALLYNGLGRYEQALATAQQASQGSPAQRFSIWGLVELVEAAARSGAPGRAADALQRLVETTRASGTDWARGIEARSRALVSDGEAAEDLYREAIDCLGRAGLRTDLARARLLYGEWLRRQRRRRDACDQLGGAYEFFDSTDAAAFAERARIELRASGGHATERAVDTRDPLTAQEGLVARLASEGASNPEIAAQMFISRATVAYHLRKVFIKLDISSRNQLARALPAQQSSGAPGPSQGLFPEDPRAAAGPWPAQVQAQDSQSIVGEASYPVSIGCDLQLRNLSRWGNRRGTDARRADRTPITNAVSFVRSEVNPR